MSENLVRRAFREGKIPGYRIGATIRIPLSYISELQQPASAIDAVIDRIVAQAPPLTDDQRNRISALLRMGKADHNGDENPAPAAKSNPTAKHVPPKAEGRARTSAA